jgi:hypothetical protein
VDIFLQDKENQEVTAKVLAKYKRELARLKSYCEGRGIHVVSGLTKELLTGCSAAPVTEQKTMCGFSGEAGSTGMLSLRQNATPFYVTRSLVSNHHLAKSAVDGQVVLRNPKLTASKV